MIRTQTDSFSLWKSRRNENDRYKTTTKMRIMHKKETLTTTRFIMKNRSRKRRKREILKKNSFSFIPPQQTDNIHQQE
jgi:hypothetical protein